MRARGPPDRQMPLLHGTYPYNSPITNLLNGTGYKDMTRQVILLYVFTPLVYFFNDVWLWPKFFGLTSPHPKLDIILPIFLL